MKPKGRVLYINVHGMTEADLREHFPLDPTSMTVWLQNRRGPFRP